MVEMDIVPWFDPFTDIAVIIHSECMQNKVTVPLSDGMHRPTTADILGRS